MPSQQVGGSVGTAGRRGGRAKGFGEMKSVDGYRGRATGFRTLHACTYTRGAGAETCGATTLWCETMGTFVSLCTAQESGLSPTQPQLRKEFARDWDAFQGSRDRFKTTTRIRHTAVVPAKVSELPTSSELQQLNANNRHHRGYRTPP